MVALDVQPGHALTVIPRAALVINSGHVPTTPSDADGDGVRVIRERRPGRSAATFFQLLAGVAILAGIAYLLLSPSATQSKKGRPADEATAPITVSAAQGAAPPAVVADAPRTPQRSSTAQPMDTSSPSPDDLPSGDPNDIATYVSPTDPEPTAAEVIQALHDIGDHTGIGAFNPPGTSPALQGLAVPDDFLLPAGYVRHHQVTDEGEPLEPILMFSPDVVFLDASGREVPIPESRVVPPDMAPPGLPIRVIAIPPKP